MSITSSNAIVMFTIPGVFNTPVQLQQFSADNVFATEALATAEVSMGVDGVLTAGFVFVPVAQGYTLMGDSESMAIFDDWYAAEQALAEKIAANAIIQLPAIRRKWSMFKGFLTSYPPIPDAGKVLAPRRFGVTWEKASLSPV